jgi:hypothetical protein
VETFPKEVVSILRPVRNILNKLKPKLQRIRIKDKIKLSVYFKEINNMRTFLH